MMDATYIETLVDRAEAAAAEAERLRKFYRRRHKRTSELRVKQLTAALEDLTEAAAPVRSAMGRLPYMRISAALEERLRDTSLSLQSERRKISKMLP
jgi:hypothetical protein